MAALSASDILQGARRIVIKIGSALLVDGASGSLRDVWLQELAADVATLRARGTDVLIVSSGSIALGRRVLGLPAGDLSLDQSQASAAVGQIRLAGAYRDALAGVGATAAQVLVTMEDSRNRRRYLNSRATIATLLSMGCVPVVNENDTVATDEIRFGDNDRLAAQIAVTSGADVLVLLSDIDGLYTGAPGSVGAMHVPVVAQITPEIEAMAGGAASETARGGMKTKVWAARSATSAGCTVLVGRGDVAGPITALQDGARATIFAARSNPAAARKQWIDAMKPMGQIVIDAGAVRALAQGKSLLPAGVRRVEGQFERGDPVDIVDPNGHHVARALAGYRSEDAMLIAGAQSGQIAELLGHAGRAALVHRDDMAMAG